MGYMLVSSPKYCYPSYQCADPLDTSKYFTSQTFNSLITVHSLFIGHNSHINFKAWFHLKSKTENLNMLKQKSNWIPTISSSKIAVRPLAYRFALPDRLEREALWFLPPRSFLKTIRNPIKMLNHMKIGNSCDCTCQICDWAFWLGWKGLIRAIFKQKLQQMLSFAQECIPCNR